MATTTCPLFWKCVVLLTVLEANQARVWWWRNARRNPKPRTAPLVCRAGAWSSWSECTPFCDNLPKRSRTRTKRNGNKCDPDTETEYCPSRGGCWSSQCDPVNKKCYCKHAGYTLKGKSCVDINECKSNGGRGPCSHRCRNTRGSFACTCNTGYSLKGSTACTLLDCLTPQFSNCPHQQRPSDAEANLPLCSKVTSSCQNGTKYNSHCSLSCPKDYQLALKNPNTEWHNYKGFNFKASSRILCHESAKKTGIWHAKLAQFYCRRSNDPPTAIRLDGNSIKEGLPLGSKVGRLKAVDVQEGQLMVFSVQMQGSNRFRCNGSVLETSMVFKWQPAGLTNSYPVKIRAQDNGSPPMWNEDTFTINVENVNDPPRSVQISRNTVYENASIGTVVGELSAIDDDMGTQRRTNFTWKLLDDTSANFNITGNKVVVQRPLNYDTIKLCYIKVSCSDAFSSTEKDIPIYIINLIDPPTLSISGNTVAENSKPGTVISQITSQSESNEDLVFMISESSPNATSRLGLSPKVICKHHKNATKFNTTCHVNITVSGKLDYEETPDFSLQIYVWNKASSNFKKWNVSVENVNEKPNVLEINGMTEIPEDMKSGVDICFFMVSDPDNRKEITQNHSCHVVNGAGNGKYFQISDMRNSLQVRENKSLNYEMSQSYLVRVECVDSGEPPMNITRDFFVNVTDTDEPIQNMTLSRQKVVENAEIGTEIGELDAYDPDIHRPKTMSFSLVNAEEIPFALEGESNKILAVNGSLNFEEKSNYMIKIRVTDSIGRNLQMPYIISIIDIPEAPTDIKLSTQVMNENLAPGSFISNITMIDEDENSLTNCRLIQNGGGRIALNETTLLAGEKRTDYEKELSHNIGISLKCCDQTKMCATKDFTITIKDINEAPRDITIDNLQVKENEKDVIIGEIHILDQDSSPEYHCSLAHDNHTQYLKVSNLSLHLIRELDFEVQQTKRFQITCKEKGNSTMQLTKEFDLRITDVNEAPLLGCQNSLYVTQKDSLGTILGSLNVTDPDNSNPKDTCYPKQRLTYSILSEETPFKVLDGFLVKTRQVEANKTYTIAVSVQDDGAIAEKHFTKEKTTQFNCTVVSRDVIGAQITLSSNQISVGSLNTTVIGNLGHENKNENMEYEVMKDKCNNYPFTTEGHKLMLMLSAYPGPKADEDYTIPQYAIVKVKAKDRSSGYVMYTRFAIFIKDNKTHSKICFSIDSVKLSRLTDTKMGPIFIKNTGVACTSEGQPIHYQCNVKTNLNRSSKGFAVVNFTNAVYVDNEMFLRVNVSIRQENYGLEKLVLDLHCWKLDSLFLFVRGSITIPIAQNCLKDSQPENNSLCSNSKQCTEPKGSLCTTIVNARQRCVESGDQLYIVLPARSQALCQFESCLQEVIRHENSSCLSTWNEKRRRKRATEDKMYVDTLKVTMLGNKRLLRAAVWEVHNNELTLVRRSSLPQLPDTDDVIFITSVEECDWLKGHNIKCPLKTGEGTSEKRSEIPPLERTMIQAAIGTGSAVLLIIVVISISYCCKKKREQNKQMKREVIDGDFENKAFDDTELKELPPIPTETTRNDSINQMVLEKGTPKYNFKNPVYEEPSQLQLQSEGEDDNENHIYSKTNSQLMVANYAEPAESEKKSSNKSMEKKAISNPVYAASDIIPVQNPQYSNPERNTEHKQQNGTKNPQYEVILLPPAYDINKWKILQQSKDQSSNGNQGSPNNRHYEELPLSSVVSTEILNKNDNKCQALKEPEYEELPEVKDEKKQKGLFRFSKAFALKQDNKTNHKNSVDADTNVDCKNSKNAERFSMDRDIPNPRECMLNPRDKAKKDNPANKYPFYEELPIPAQDKKRTESCLSQDSNRSERRSGAPHYHVLEAPEDKKESGQDNEETTNEGKSIPHYFVLEKSSSTGKEYKQYQSLHRELDQPSPTYEAYRLPQ